jgi:hypothetical protein
MIKRFTLFCFISLFILKLSLAQLSAPKVEGVFGGYVSNITGYTKNSDTTRLFISTQSANSIFYTDLYNPSDSNFKFTKFKKLPAADDTKNFGQNVNTMAVHKSSGRLYFGHNSGLYAVSADLNSTTKYSNFGISNIIIKDSVLIYLEGSQLHWGKLNTLGNFTHSSTPSLNFPPTPSLGMIQIHPITNKVYVYFGGTSPILYKLSDDFFNLNNTTTYSSIAIGTPANTELKVMGISPSGRIFLGGNQTTFPQNRVVRYTDNETTWNHVNTGLSGYGGSNFDFSGTASNYVTYFSTSYSMNQGSNWIYFGNTFQDTHPNDGPVFTDPNDSNVVYMVTDLCIAASKNRGASINDIDNGVEAVQVRDFDMTSDKNTAWIASKAGIRKVSNYTVSPVWTKPMFPNGDGSPYYSADMHPSDTNTVYVGNSRVYKTTNGGLSWNQVFNAESFPYNFPLVGTFINAIEICQFNPNIVFAGFEIQHSDEGGLFYSMNAGNSWSQLLLEASVNGKDVDVTDIIFNIEGTDTVAYVSVKYDLASPQGRSVYRIIKSGSTWTASQNMNAGNTSTSSLIVASLEDIERSSTGDTLYITGTDAGNNHPVAYYKPISSSNKWTPMRINGFPAMTNKKGKAITLGNDTVYCAVDNEIYLYPLQDSVWYLGYAYPVGTEINFLYFDDLLAGTGTGLYGHSYIPNRCKPAILLNNQASICQGDSFLYNGKIYKNPGLYQDTLKTFIGCDSIISNLNLTLNSTYNFNNSVSMCFGGTFMFPDGTKSNISITHPSLLKSKGGCDSIVTITLTVNRPDVSIVRNPGTLTANQANASYQWLDCANAYSPIPGANQKIFSPVNSGNYAVEVTKDNCKDTSLCELVVPVGLSNLVNKNTWLFYPNPFLNTIKIENLLNAKTLEIQIFDLTGKEINQFEVEGLKTKEIDLSALEAGVYLISANGAKPEKIFKR